MTYYFVEMKRVCKLCQGTKGFCSYFDVGERSRPCSGLLNNRPSWCPLVPVREAKTQFDVTYSELWIKDNTVKGY